MDKNKIKEIKDLIEQIEGNDKVLRGVENSTIITLTASIPNRMNTDFLDCHYTVDKDFKKAIICYLKEKKILLEKEFEKL